MSSKGDLGIIVGAAAGVLAAGTVGLSLLPAAGIAALGAYTGHRLAESSGSHHYSMNHSYK